MMARALGSLPRCTLLLALWKRPVVCGALRPRIKSKGCAAMEKSCDIGPTVWIAVAEAPFISHSITLPEGSRKMMSLRPSGNS